MVICAAPLSGFCGTGCSHQPVLLEALRHKLAAGEELAGKAKQEAVEAARKEAMVIV